MYADWEDICKPIYIVLPYSIHTLSMCCNGTKCYNPDSPTQYVYIQYYIIMTNNLFEKKLRKEARTIFLKVIKRKHLYRPGNAETAKPRLGWGHVDNSVPLSPPLHLWVHEAGQWVERTLLSSPSPPQGFPARRLRQERVQGLSQGQQSVVKPPHSCQHNKMNVVFN